jgi:hypothetical protein
VHKAGAWFTYKEEQIGQGRENAKAFLTEHPDVLAEIEGLIRAALATANAPEAPADTVSEVPPPADPLPSDEEVDIVKAVAARAGSAKKK